MSEIEKKELERKSRAYAWKILVMCCCLSGAVAGMVVHCKGIFYAPASADIGVSATIFATYSTFGSLAGVIAMPFITKLFNTKNLKVVLISYLAVFCGSDVLMGMATSMWQCYIFGIMQGLVSSFLTLYPIAYLLRNWFTEKRGLVTGIATMFAGLFSSIMNMVLNSFIENIGWRKTYILVGISAFILSAVPVLLFAVRKPSDIGLEPFGGVKDIAVKVKKKEKLSKDLFVSMVPVIILAFSFYMATGYNQHLPNYAKSIGYATSVGASIMSICMLGNTVAKLILGYLNDKIGVYRTSLITVLTMSISLFALMFKPTQLWILYCAAVFLGQATAFIVVQIPLLLSDQYPIQTQYETCLSTVMMVGSLTSAANNMIINFLFTASGSYSLGQGISGGSLILCACMILILKFRADKRKDFSCKN